MPLPDDADVVLSALRLGWYVAEVRGRNRPDGPRDDAGMPDHHDHALPLRIERSTIELQVEALSVMEALAKDLDVDQSVDGVSFSALIRKQAELLRSKRALRVDKALRAALELVQRGPAGQVSKGEEELRTTGQAVEVLKAALDVQHAVVAHRAYAIAVAQQELAKAQQQVAAAASQPAEVQAQLEEAKANAEGAVQHAQATIVGEQGGAAVLEQTISALQAVAPDSDAAAQSCSQAIRAGRQVIEEAAGRPWAVMTDFIWKFDANIQDRLTAKSDRLAIGYQLGRGLAECYWALNPDQVAGSQGWTFLFGASRCDELSRLLGRLADYMKPYAAPAIAGSLKAWQAVAATPGWREAAYSDLSQQIGIWYALTVLGEDPTTLIPPYAHLHYSWVMTRTIRTFLAPIIMLVIGAAALVALILLLGSDTGGTIDSTLLAIVAAAGISTAGLSVKRFRQDLFTDLTAIAITKVPLAP